MVFAGAALSAVLAIGFADAAAHSFADSRSPQSVARRYLSAVSDGDAAAALAYADQPPASGEYLTADVLGQQLRIAKLTDLTVLGARRSGPDAEVRVSYVLRFADHPVTQQDQIDLVARGSSWRLKRVATEVALPSVTTGADRLTFAGRPFASGGGLLFPGALPVGTDTPAVQVANDPAVRLADADIRPVVTPAVSATTQRQVAAALDTALAKCLAAGSSNPLCPVVPGGRPVPGSLHGTLTRKIADSDPTVVLSGRGGGALVVTAQAQLDATWEVWDFENIEQVRRGAATVAVRAVGSVDDPETVAWTDAGD